MNLWIPWFRLRLKNPRTNKFNEVIKQIYSFATFISIVLLVSFAINFYVLARLAGLFRIKKSFPFWILLFFCSISFIAASVFQSHTSNILCRIIYVIAANWWGILWLFFSTLIVYEILKLFIKFNSFTAGLLIVIIVVAVFFWLKKKGFIKYFSLFN